MRWRDLDHASNPFDPQDGRQRGTGWRQGIIVALMKIALSWSSGKDSAWTLQRLREQHPGCTAALVTTVNEAFDRVAMHAVRRTLLAAQADAVGLPLYAVDLPWPCSNEAYETRMGDLVRRLEEDGFTHMAFGNLFLEDVRRYREERLAATGLTPIFPLWKTTSTAELAREMIGGGLRASLTCVDPRVLPAAFAGRQFDHSLLADLPAGVDPCGENGEFHSFVWDGPMLARPIPITVGDTIERDGFVFADIIPAAADGLESSVVPYPPHHRLLCREARLFAGPRKQVAGLTIQFATEGFERRKANRASLVGFQNREVRDRDANSLRQFGERQAAFEQHVVEFDVDGHGVGQTVSDCSSSSRAPALNTSASARMINPCTRAKPFRSGRARNSSPGAVKWVIA